MASSAQRRLFGLTQSHLAPASLVTALFCALALIATPTASAAIRPIAAYSFDENTGTTAHDSASNHDGTIQNATWTTGKYGSALDFNGTNALVSIADANDLDLSTSFTLEAWVRPDTLVNSDSVIAKAELSGSNFSGYGLTARGLADPPAGMIANNTALPVSANGTSSLPTAQWSHLALTYDGANLRLYVDGVLVKTKATTTVPPGTSAALQIGHSIASAGIYFDGAIDEVRIYNQPLDQSQIQSDKDTAVGLDPLPIAAYSFDENTGTTAHDSASNHDGTIQNATWTTGKYGSALDFNGTNALVSIADANDLDLSTSFTLEAWVRPDTLVNSDSVIAKAELSGSNFSGYGLTARGLADPPAGMIANNTALPVAANGTSSLPTGAWSHLALTYDGANLRLYVDGVLVKTKATTTVPPGTSAALQIGHSIASAGIYFDGAIDEVRLYNKPLSQGQITADRDSAVTPPAPHDYTTTTLDTGASAEKAASTLITSSGTDTVVYSLPVDSLNTDEVLSATGNLEVTNTHAYDVTDSVRLVLGSDANDANGTAITPWSAATQTSDTLHLTLPIDGDYRAPSNLGTQYLKVILKASSPSAGSGDTLKVEPGFGSLSATRYTPTDGNPISQPTHKIQPLIGPTSEQISSLPVDSVWRVALSRRIGQISTDDIIDATSQLGVQNTSGTTVQLESKLVLSNTPTDGGPTISEPSTDRLTTSMSSTRLVDANPTKITDPAKRYVNLWVRAVPVSGTPSPLTITQGSGALDALRLVPNPGTPSADLGVGTREDNPSWSDVRDVTSIPFAVPGGSEKRVVAHLPIYELRKGDIIRARGLVTGDLGGNEGAQVLTRLIVADSPTDTTGDTVGVFSGDNFTKAQQIHTSVKEGTYVAPATSLDAKFLNFVVYASQASPSGSMGVSNASVSYKRSMPTAPLDEGFENGLDALWLYDNHGTLSASTDVAREGEYSLLSNMDFSKNVPEPGGNLHNMVAPPDASSSGGYEGEDGWYGFSAYFPKDGFTLEPNDAHFDGKIDEVRIYNQPLDQSQIQADENGDYGSQLQPNPVAAYGFDEGTGTTADDSSGNGHNGAIQDATWTSSGKYGSALDFNGKDSVVTIPDANDLDLTNSFTLEAWVNPDTLSRWSPIITKAQSTSLKGYRLNAQVQAFHDFDVDTHSAASSAGSAANASVQGDPLPTGTWSHMAVTSDGTNLRLYINGQLVDTELTTSATQTSTDLQIGASDFVLGGALLTIFAQWHATTQDAVDLGCSDNPDGVPISFSAHQVKAGEYINPAKTEKATQDGDYLAVNFEGGQLSDDCSQQVTPSQSYILAPLERDHWNDFVLHTKWTTDEAPAGTSNSEVWLDGKQLLGEQSTPVTIPSLAWRLSPDIHDTEATASYGIYRHITASQPTAKLYIDALRRGNSYAQVAPGQ